jgi:hypothetical protein
VPEHQVIAIVPYKTTAGSRARVVQAIAGSLDQKAGISEEVDKPLYSKKVWNFMYHITMEVAYQLEMQVEELAVR